MSQMDYSGDDGDGCVDYGDYEHDDGSNYYRSDDGYGCDNDGWRW